MRRLPGAYATLALVLLAATTAPTASAHQGEPDPIVETVTLAPGDVARVPVPQFEGHDTLAYSWTARGAVAALNASIAWIDLAGERHPHGRLDGETGEGVLRGHKELAGAEMLFTNEGTEGDVEITYSTLSSASFWRTPSLFLPALTPVILLVAAAAAGTWWDRRRRAEAEAAAGEPQEFTQENRDSWTTDSAE